jgi:hypothetical protein
MHLDIELLMGLGAWPAYQKTIQESKAAYPSLRGGILFFTVQTRPTIQPKPRARR